MLNKWMVSGLVVLLAATPLLAQESKRETKGSVSPLGIRQERVQRMMEDVERKFNGLIQSLQQTEAERAERLQLALNEAKKLGLLKRMGEISKLLDQAELEGANDGQKKVLVDLKELIALLLDDNRDGDKLKEFEQLQQWKKELENILNEERNLKRESDKVSDKDKALSQLDSQIKAIESLIEKQKGVIKTTEDARTEGLQKFGPIANQQEELRSQTESVANKLAEEATGEKPSADAPAPKGADDQPAGKNDKPAAGEKKPAENSPGKNDGKPSEGKPSDGKKSDGKKSDGKPSDGKPSDGKPSDGKPSDGKPSDGKPSDGKPSDGSESPKGDEPKPSPAPANRQPEPGEKPLRNAAENQKQAAKNLQEGKGKAAQGEEQRALDDLQKALAELKREQQRIASLPPEALRKMADKQDQTAEKTAGLEKNMEQAKAGGKSDGKSGEGKSGGKKPGQQRVQQAQKHMEQASGDLRKQDPSDAARQQQKAIKELEQALQEIEERLAQLREETQVEKLARLEARFRAMLARQQKVTAETAAIHKRMASGGDDLKRAERNALSGEEAALSEEAQLALEIILDDGTSVVFPDIVTNLHDDLGRAAELIGNDRVDLLTQNIQKEIETTLEELIEALQKAQQQKEGGEGGGGGGGGGQEPLLPGSAELKLLRAAQLRINRRTESLSKLRDGGADEAQKQEFQTMSRRQSEIAEMTIRILERGQ